MVVARGSSRLRAKRRQAPLRRSSPLGEFAQLATILADRVTGSMLKDIRWCPHQEDWLRFDPKVRPKLLRCGNQLGKSIAGLAEIIFRCMGHHPFLDVPNRPIEAWIVCTTWKQSMAIQKKFFALVPKELLAENVDFTDELGFGTNPVVVFKNGSVVRFKTTKQGAANLASDTVDVVLIDEITTRRVFRELQQRVKRKGGVLLLTITPINGDSEWLQQLCEKGHVEDMHYKFEAKNFVPNDGLNRPIELEDGTPMDQTWVQLERNKLDDDPDAATILDGEWPSGDSDRELMGWTDALKFDRHTQLPPFIMYGLVMDHGERSGREVALVIGVDAQLRMWVLAEYASTGVSGLEGDIEAIADIIVRELGLQLDMIDLAVGDINSAGQIMRGTKVNQYIEGLFAEINGGVLPFRIVDADKSISVDARIFMLNASFAKKRIRVHESCTHLLRCIKRWKGQNNRLKDPIDALGYFHEKIRPMRQARAASLTMA